MLYFTGDLHGEIGRFYELYRKNPNLGAEDYLIVCGDFGFVFRNDQNEHIWLDDLSCQPYTICFVDGNHENFNALYSYPVEKWKGGKVHKIRNNIIHLIRGQVFEINDKRIFTMGGAYSIDRYMRKLNFSYWEEEIPSKEEYTEASRNLEAYGYKVDYIVTHTAPREIIRRMGYDPDPHDMELTGFLEWVMYKAQYDEWFFGHWHEDRNIEKFHALLFEYIIR